MKKVYIFLVAFLAIFASCSDDAKVIDPPIFKGGAFEPTVGGPNQPNQVFVDFSSNTQTTAQRDTWDLGFYSGNQFRVAINGSIYMAVKALSTTDINSVTEADVAALKNEVIVKSGQVSGIAYIDAPDGDITKTAIAEISNDNSQNFVYLVNLGFEVGKNEPALGSVEVSGAERGWKKIRITKQGNDYKLQYANLDDTTHKEVIIKKQPDYNFAFYSLVNEKEVSVQPVKKDWDICFTVYTNVLPGYGTYGFSDFVYHNRKGGAIAYKIDGTAADYTAFTKSDIDESLFSTNQTTIGSSWRDVFNKTVKDELFYIVKDANGLYYKVKFLSLVGVDGKRGKPRFEFQLLN